MAIHNLGFNLNKTGTNLLIIQLVFLIFAWLASLMRAFVKLVLLRKVTVDDYLMLLALLGYTATGYFVISAIIEGGLGKPAVELRPEEIEIQLRSLFGNMVTSGLVSGLVRVSIALFLLRIAIRKWHRFLLHGIMGATTVVTLVYFFFTVFQCSPPSDFWRKTRDEESRSCALSRAVDVTTVVWGALSAAMDWMLGLLPVAILWHVRINWQAKVGIASVLSLAIISGMALVTRMIFISRGARTRGYSEYGTLAISITANVELGLGIVAGCIVALPTLFKKLRLGQKFKRRVSQDTIPWQKSFLDAGHRHQSAEDIILQAPRRLHGAKDLQSQSTETQSSSRLGIPSAKRARSSSNRVYEVGVDGARDDEATLVPHSAKEIQVRTFIHVASQPTNSSIPANAVEFANKPLPIPPQAPKMRDRPIVRSRPHTPLFL
ncbi:hypothetical protein GGS21DRAFT_319667 [Xylaria nigripes]|nr:hypothetical protein GGS21DRAFT_319667 [Xylaria nigripes]